MNYKIATNYKKDHQAILELILNFENKGKKFDDRNRNSIKLFTLGNKTINIKSFKVPNLINKVAYKAFRSSKAERSFTYAHKLLEIGVLTPAPLGYFEEKGLLFGRSFYVSEHLDYDLTYRELAHSSPYQGNEEILRAFTQFTFGLHEKGVHFLDHSPGNTLIVAKEGHYDFYLVDLNRMEFDTMDFKTRMANFKKLSHRDQDIAIMADEYATLSGYNKEKVHTAMRSEILKFQESFHKKKRLKRRLKFWK